VLVADATFFGKRREKFGVLVGLDIWEHRVVFYRFITSETLDAYRMMKESLETQGFVIRGVVTDGKPGLSGTFEGIPTQLCHFHQQAIITRYLTRHPRMKASKDLQRISRYLGRVGPKRFACLLHAWHDRHEAFLNEKVPDDSRRGWHYKHKRLRSAYRSLKRHLPWLFTYRNHSQLHIPNTTNALDGGVFSPLKDLLRVHRGLNKKMKKKLIVDFLEKRT